jgi:hypothetical protein
MTLASVQMQTGVNSDRGDDEPANQVALRGETHHGTVERNRINGLVLIFDVTP